MKEINDETQKEKIWNFNPMIHQIDTDSLRLF